MPFTDASRRPCVRSGHSIHDVYTEIITMPICATATLTRLNLSRVWLTCLDGLSQYRGLKRLELGALLVTSLEQFRNSSEGSLHSLGVHSEVW
jgi:hypothetical protein